MDNVASYYLNLLMVNLFNLVEDLCVEVLIPIYWDLWQRLLLVGNCALIVFSTMLYQIQRCIHQLMRYMRYQPVKALLNGIHWTYYGLVILYQHNAYKVILRAIQYHLLFSLTMACLDWMWMVGSQAVKIGLQFLKQEELQISDSSSAVVNSAVCTSTFHVNEVTLNQHDPQPNSSIFQKFSSSLSFMSVYTKIKEGIRNCCFGTSSGQITRIQGNDEENSELSLSSEDIIHQMKSTFVTFFLFYIYNTFLFVQVIK